LLNKLRARVSAAIKPIATGLAKLGLSPNSITVIGFLISIASAYLFFISQQQWGGAVLLLSGLFDILDGAVAKVSGRVTKFGGILDSVLDRYSDLIILAAIVVAGLTNIFIGMAAIIGSVMVSYSRARGELEGVKMASVGLMERAERIVVLAITALVGYVWVGVAVLAVLANFTVAQRLYHSWKSLKTEAKVQ
jgi:archaetidylinositol phosphate synthase